MAGRHRSNFIEVDTGSKWWERGMCYQRGTAFFFPEGDRDRQKELVNIAKAMCEACEVAQECLDYALATDEEFGIWGGHTEQEIRRFIDENNQ